MAGMVTMVAGGLTEKNPERTVLCVLHGKSGFRG